MPKNQEVKTVDTSLQTNAGAKEERRNQWVVEAHESSSPNLRFTERLVIFGRRAPENASEPFLFVRPLSSLR